MAGRIAIGIVDDDTMLVESLKALLDRDERIDVTRTAATVPQYLAAEGVPGITVLDLNLGDHSSLTSNIKALKTAGSAVIVTSIAPDRAFVIQAIGAGAETYVTKSRGVEALLQAILDVSAGEVTFSQEDAYYIATDSRLERPELTEKQRQVVERYAGGMLAKQVASDLCIEVSTVNTHIARVKQAYTAAGRPTYTRSDIAKRLEEDRVELRGLGPLNEDGQ